MSLRDRAGSLAGSLSVPLFAALAVMRRARVFHPDGIVFGGSVEPIVDGDDGNDDGEARRLGERLRGPALVRFSAALWRSGHEWPDVLGCALRFRASDAPTAEPEEGDQDLLFATVRSPMTLWLGPAGTHVHDFLANRYFATAPFEVRDVGRVKWRLVPEGTSYDPVDGGNRSQRLAAMVARGDVSLRLDMRHVFRRTWVPVARVRLEREVRVDQDRLRFFPFRAGRGIVPSGFVQALRRGAYSASQMAGHPRAKAPPQRADEDRDSDLN